MMSLAGKQLDSITEADLQALVNNQVREGRTIEYKEALPGNSDSEKKEFLADASSFANAAGGDLIYGIQENTGLPVSVSGCPIADTDAEIRRLDSIIQSGIDPRIPGVFMRDVALSNGQVAIIIRIQKSWASPHMIIFKGWARFYSRNSAGKYMLDVPELRAAFILSETTGERIRQFRTERLSKIVADEAPLPLGDSAKMVLHIVPFNAFNPRVTYNVADLANETSGLRPLYMHVGGWSYRHNFDGFLTYTHHSDQAFAESYLQVFRNGIIEAVDAMILRDYDSRREIPSKLYEMELLDAVPKYIALQKRIAIEPPLLVMVSFLGVKDYQLSAQEYRFRRHLIDRDALIISEILVESFQYNLAAMMRPIFDAVWNAAGFPYCMNYDENGTWRN